MKVVKIGGSLLNSASRIMHVFEDYEVLIVPGGGIFADAVRNVCNKHGISQRAAHWMAIMATHQYGHFLSDISGIPTITSLDGFNRQAILLPLDIVANSSLEPSWVVTSDTIACYVARLAGEKEFIKLTDVEGVMVEGHLAKIVDAGKLLNTTTCLDKSLPTYLQAWKMNCRVVNGKTESNIRRVLEEEPIGTLIIGG
jgi:aspartokinase-like uncharacterized kinase